MYPHYKVVRSEIDDTAVGSEEESKVKLPDSYAFDVDAEDLAVENNLESNTPTLMEANPAISFRIRAPEEIQGIKFDDDSESEDGEAGRLPVRVSTYNGDEEDEDSETELKDKDVASDIDGEEVSDDDEAVSQSSGMRIRDSDSDISYSCYPSSLKSNGVQPGVEKIIEDSDGDAEEDDDTNAEIMPDHPTPAEHSPTLNDSTLIKEATAGSSSQMPDGSSGLHEHLLGEDEPLSRYDSDDDFSPPGCFSVCQIIGSSLKWKSK